jgi:hypothetical protein
MMRCGRYGYREVEIHTTNPDHLVPRDPYPTNTTLVRVADRYAAGRNRG